MLKHSVVMTQRGAWCVWRWHFCHRRMCKLLVWTSSSDLWSFRRDLAAQTQSGSQARYTAVSGHRPCLRSIYHVWFNAFKVSVSSAHRSVQCTVLELLWDIGCSLWRQMNAAHGWREQAKWQDAKFINELEQGPTKSHRQINVRLRQNEEFQPCN